MSEYLFAYGTLQPGLAPAHLARVMRTLQLVGKGVVRGLLYDLGEYPGAVVDSLSAQRIFGTVFRLAEDAGVLRALDAYEDFDKECPEASLFVRELHAVELESGEALPCWVYVYNGAVASRTVIASGRFAG